jgi:hypothetical protein
VKRREHRQVGGAVFEHLVEVPDFEMIAHADQQRALGDRAARVQPWRDRDTAAAVEPGRRDEPEGAPPRRIVRARVVVGALRTLAAMPRDDTGAVVHDHAGCLVVQSDEQMVVHRPRLNGDAECVVQRKVAANANTRQRAADKEIIHRIMSIETKDAGHMPVIILDDRYRYWRLSAQQYRFRLPGHLRPSRTFQ